MRRKGNILVSWITSTDHKTIGYMYLITTFVYFCLGGVMALIMRAQLFEPGLHLCAACTASCPVFWTDGQYFGPAAIVNAHRFIFDSRDMGAQVHLDILNDREGVWRCRTIFNCTDACPRGIQVIQAIAEVKQAIMRGTA